MDLVTHSESRAIFCLGASGKNQRANMVKTNFISAREWTWTGTSRSWLHVLELRYLEMRDGPFRLSIQLVTSTVMSTLVPDGWDDGLDSIGRHAGEMGYLPFHLEFILWQLIMITRPRYLR